MERAGLRSKTWSKVRLRRVYPGLARAAMWLALACLALPLLPAKVFADPGQPGGGVLASLIAAAGERLGYFVAAAAAFGAAAGLAARGLSEAVTVALDSRCLYVATRRLERRTPRWMIEDGIARPPSLRAVLLQLSSGRELRLEFDGREAARGFLDALYPARNGTRSSGRASAS